MTDLFHKNRNTIRVNLLDPFLRGGMQCAEIGAGPYPQKLPDNVDVVYFDKRNEEELREYFKTGVSSVLKSVLPVEEMPEYKSSFDVVIAHHVLEHSPNPVETLIAWNALLKNGGYMCLSVPDARKCFDRERLPPSPQHIIHDYVFQRSMDDFESREHIYNFINAWRNDPFFGPLDKNEIADLAYQSVNSSVNDCHWHAFNKELLLSVVYFASYFSGRGVEVKAFFDGEGDKAAQMSNDLIVIYRISENEINKGNVDFAHYNQIISDTEKSLMKAIAKFRKRE